MDELAQPGVAVMAEKAPDGAGQVVMVDVPGLAVAGVVGSADGARSPGDPAY